MNPLRFFVRGFARTVMRGIARRMAGRVAARSGTRTMGRMMSRETDDLVNEMADQIDVLEALELAADAFMIIEEARAEAIAGSVTAIYDLMGSMNRGQRALAEQYCLPYVEEYWATTEAPDPDDFLSGMYAQHEAIEQALSDTCEMSYEAGRQSGAQSLFAALSAYIAEALIARGMDAASVNRASADWGNFSEEILAEQMSMRQMIRTGTVPDNIRLKYDGENLQWMVINRPGMGTGAERQLSWDQFMGSDQPYWFTESRRMLYAQIQGHMSYEEYQSKRSELYRKTFNDPWSTSPPANYNPYSGRNFSYNR